MAINGVYLITEELLIDYKETKILFDLVTRASREGKQYLDVKQLLEKFDDVRGVRPTEVLNNVSVCPLTDLPYVDKSKYCK